MECPRPRSLRTPAARRLPRAALGGAALLIALAACRLPAPGPGPDGVAAPTSEGEGAATRSPSQEPSSTALPPAATRAPDRPRGAALPAVGYLPAVAANPPPARRPDLLSTDADPERPGAEAAVGAARLEGAGVPDAPGARTAADAWAVVAGDPGAPAARAALMAGALGFGRAARGGLDGPTVRVTTLADDGPGSLRALAEDGSGPRWITFDVDGVIRLRRPIVVASDTTIDGRGRRVELTDHGLDIKRVAHVVVANLVLRQGQEDAVVVHHGAHDVWLHHLTLQAWTDGLIDIQRGGTDVTVSWCHFLDHEKVMLIGADAAHEGDADIRVTLHHNLFERTGQRHPRLRWGRVHAFNNVLWHWQSYGMASDQLGQLLVERNVFDPGPDAEEAVKVEAADGVPGRIRAIGNLVLGDVPLAQNAPEAVFVPDYPYAAEPADEALVARVRADVGWRPDPTAR